MEVDPISGPVLALCYMRIQEDRNSDGGASRLLLGGNLWDRWVGVTVLGFLPELPALLQAMFLDPWDPPIRCPSQNPEPAQAMPWEWGSISGEKLRGKYGLAYLPEVLAIEFLGILRGTCKHLQ